MTFREAETTLKTLARSQPPKVAEALQMAAELCGDRAAKAEKLDSILKKGDPIWYVDSRGIEEGKVASVVFENERVAKFSVKFTDTENIEEFYGHCLGIWFFKSREMAEDALTQKREE